MLGDESTAKFEIELVNKQVQKIKQAKKDCQTHYGKQLGCGTCKALQLCMWIDKLVDTIEAMRKHIETLQAENEQLKKERDQAIRDIDKGNCRSCVYDGKKICYGNMHGKDREVAKEQGLPYCIGWQWRGLEEGSV